MPDLSCFCVKASVLLLGAPVSGICITEYSLLKSTLLVAGEYMEANDITEENALYEGYTTFDPPSSKYPSIPYDFISSEYELIYSVTGDNYSYSGNIFENIRHAVEYLLTEYDAGGATISIYNLIK